MNLRIRHLLYSALIIVVSLSCTEHLSQEKLFLNRSELQDLLYKQESFDSYISTISKNLIVIYESDENSYKQLKQLELEVRENNSYELSMQLLSVYKDIDYDINFHHYYSELTTMLNFRYTYSKEDLTNIIGAAVQESMMNYGISARVKTPLGYGCVEPCQSNANSAYDSSIEGSSGIEKTILIAQKMAYFQGCYDYCIDYPQTPN